MSKHRTVMSVSIAAFASTLAVACASPAEAGWGRYRVSTYYGTASVPVVKEAVVVGGAYRPVLVAPAPVTAYYGAPLVVTPAPVTAYYAAPAVNVFAPRRAHRTTYFAPAPAVHYYAPAPVPATYYYDRYPSGTVILP